MYESIKESLVSISSWQEEKFNRDILVNATFRICNRYCQHCSTFLLLPNDTIIGVKLNDDNTVYVFCSIGCRKIFMFKHEEFEKFTLTSNKNKPKAFTDVYQALIESMNHNNDIIRTTDHAVYTAKWANKIPKSMCTLIDKEYTYTNCAIIEFPNIEHIGIE